MEVGIFVYTRSKDIGLFLTYTNRDDELRSSLVHLFKSIVFRDNSITTLNVSDYNPSRQFFHSPYHLADTPYVLFVI